MISQRLLCQNLTKSSRRIGGTAVKMNMLQRRSLSSSSHLLQRDYHGRRLLQSPSSSNKNSIDISSRINIRSVRFLSAAATKPFDLTLTEKEKQFLERGWLDERGLTKFETLHELRTRCTEIYAENDLFGTYSSEKEQFEYITYKEFSNLVDRAQYVLNDLGIEQYGKIGLISNNRWEWVALASAAFSMNAAIIPMYEAQLPSDWSYIVNDSGCSVLFCANQDIFDRVQKHVVPSAPMLQASMCFDGAPEGAPYSFKSAMVAAEVALSKESATKVSGGLLPLPEDLANLIYTSGTTGKPKGVELTHQNFTSNIIGSTRVAVENPKDFVRESDRSLAFLPWAHSYGQTCELWVGMAHGSSTGICRGVTHILDDLQMVKPSVLFAVPTLYKKIYDGVQNIMESSTGTKKKLMQRALELGVKKAGAKRDGTPSLGMWENMQHNVLDAVILSKIRARFGGNLRHGFVAGAACPKEVIDFMDSLGIAIYEGYGLTETSPIITMNSPGKHRPGSVGPPIGGVDVYIIDPKDGKTPLPPGQKGEICCTGLNVMKGYYKNQEETDKVISVAPDGVSRMFHTGDVGTLTEDGFVMVTGRIKEQYKLENGKFVVPSPIEEAIGMSRFISQVVLHGANRPYNVVLIDPEWNAIRAELATLSLENNRDDNKQVNISDLSEEDLANDIRVKELIHNEIHDNCYNFKKFEIPQKYALIAPCTVANNMLTAKMSIRRHQVIQSYEELVSELYNNNDDHDSKKNNVAA